jgi:uncharacterized protein YktB (UPF0637 family)
MKQADEPIQPDEELTGGEHAPSLCFKIAQDMLAHIARYRIRYERIFF